MEAVCVTADMVCVATVDDLAKLVAAFPGTGHPAHQAVRSRRLHGDDEFVAR